MQLSDYLSWRILRARLGFSGPFPLTQFVYSCVVSCKAVSSGSGFVNNLYFQARAALPRALSFPFVYSYIFMGGVVGARARAVGARLQLYIATVSGIPKTVTSVTVTAS